MRELPERGQDARFAGLGYKQGFYLCDLSGFAMMLIKRSVFKKLDKPYFRLNHWGGNGNYATDIDFCDRLKEKDIPIWGCFDYCLAHRDITPENRMEKLIEGMKVSRENDIIEKYNLIRRKKENESFARDTANCR
jgi:GT2 family glycosyltransferase